MEFNETELFMEIKKIGDEDFDITNIINLIMDDPHSTETRGSFDETCLHILLTPNISERDYKCVVSVCYVLVESGMDVNAQDCQGNTPLHVAIINELPQCIVCALLRLGAQSNIRNSSGQLPSDLCKSAAIRHLMAWFGSGLWTAVCDNDVTMVERLIDSWCWMGMIRGQESITERAERNINKKNLELLNNYKPTHDLIVAAISGNVKRVKNCMQNKSANVNTQETRSDMNGKKSSMPLICEIIQLSQHGCARELLKRDTIDVNTLMAFSDGKMQPLYLYLLNYLDSTKDAKLMLDLVKKGNLQLLLNGSHFEVFYMAWKKKWPPKVVTKLMEGGLNILSRDNKGYTVRDHILESTQTYTVEERRESLYYFDQFIIKWLTSGDVDKLEAAALRGYDYFYCTDSDGKSLKSLAKEAKKKKSTAFLKKIPNIQERCWSIHNGLRIGNLSDVKAHLDDDIHSTSTDRAQHTPLHTAVLYERKFAVKFITTNYPKCINQRDMFDRTALHYAMCIGSDGREIQEMLIRAGADHNITDKDDLAPADYGAQSNSDSTLSKHRQLTFSFDTFLLDRYFLLQADIEADDLEHFRTVLGTMHGGSLHDFDTIFPTRFTELPYAPILRQCIAHGREKIAVHLLDEDRDSELCRKLYEHPLYTLSPEEVQSMDNMDTFVEALKKAKAKMLDMKRARKTINVFRASLQKNRRRSMIARTDSEDSNASIPPSIMSCSLPSMRTGDEQEVSAEDAKVLDEMMHDATTATSEQDLNPVPNSQKSSACVIL